MATMTSDSKRKKKSRPATLAEVGRLAGVDSSTASQVLNGRENCWASAATRERIFKAAEELGYRPNMAARSLRLGRTHNLGMILASFGSGQADGFEAAAAEAGYITMMSFNPNDPAQENLLIQNHLDRGVDGLVVYPSETGEHEELRKLIRRGFPVVTLDGACRLDFAGDDVSPDFREVGRLQAEHLLALGRRRIALADAVPEAKVNTIRNQAIEEIMLRQGLPEPLRMKLHQTAERKGWAPMEMLYPQILDFIQRCGRDIDAVISYDSLGALTVRALLTCGLRVPEDVAVVGAGNSMLASHCVIPLTSVDTDNEWIGAEAFRLLQRRMENSDAASLQIHSRSIIIPRGSSSAGTITPASV